MKGKGNTNEVREGKILRFLDCKTRFQGKEEQRTEDGWYAVENGSFPSLGNTGEALY